MTTAALTSQLIKQLDRIENQCSVNAQLLVRLETRIDSYDARADGLDARLSEIEKYTAQQQGRQQANRTLLAAIAGLGGLGSASGVIAILRSIL